MSNHLPRRVKFVRAQLQHLSPSQCLARMELERPESGSYVGTATGGCPDVAGLRATAQATAAALIQAVGDEHALTVHAVELFDAFGQSAVLVHLGAKRQERTQALMGFCVAGADQIPTGQPPWRCSTRPTGYWTRADVSVHPPWEAFSAEEALRIREMIVTPGASLRCPRCGGQLTSEMPLAGGHSIAAVWEFRCDTCGRSLIARDLPGLT